MGLPGMVLSALSTVVGAIMYFAVTAPSYNAAQQDGFRLSTIGAILMTAGVFGFVASMIVFSTSRRSPTPPERTLDREVVNASGERTLLHERQN